MTFARASSCKTNRAAARPLVSHALDPQNAGHRQRVAAMQGAWGNQAALRMLGYPQINGELHRKCSCGGSGGAGGECAECAGKRDASLNRKVADVSASNGVPPVVNDVLRSCGQPLDADVRTFMEPRLGFDLSAIRVHTGRQAADSAAAVNALAYTVGRHIVFGAGQYSPGCDAGRRLIAHELAHVVQQGAGDDMPPQTISDPADASEREADRAAEAALSPPPVAEFRPSQTVARVADSSRLQPKMPANRGVLQRKIVVDPPGEARFILGELDVLCPGQLAVSGDTITQSCKASTNQSCECACDAAGDPARTYTVHVRPAAGTTTVNTLWDGSQQAVPDSSVRPHTSVGNDPDIYVEGAGSSNEFGSFRPDGSASWAPHWRILAHELCGHGRLHQTYSGGPGNRPGHDVTIDTENAIAAEQGEPSRGHFTDPRQGESFYNPIGDRSKVVSYQTNGLHYEAP
jgi:hypothetical protein